QTIGLVYISSSLMTILIYFQPVLVALIAWFWLGELMTLKKITGLVIGFCGIIIVSMDGISNQVSIFGITLGLFTAFFWAFGVCYIKKTSSYVDALWMVALQSIIGGIILTGFGTFFENWTDILFTPVYFFGLIYGSTFGIPIALIIYYTLVNRGEAGKVSSFTFFVPIVSVLIGVLFLEDSLTYKLLIGLLLVVISIYLVSSSGNMKNSMKNNMKLKF